MRRFNSVIIAVLIVLIAFSGMAVAAMPFNLGKFGTLDLSSRIEIGANNTAGFYTPATFLDTNYKLSIGKQLATGIDTEFKFWGPYSVKFEPYVSYDINKAINVKAWSTFWTPKTTPTYEIKLTATLF